MPQDSASTSAGGGSQGPLVPTHNNSAMKIYMMNVDARLSTRTRDYGRPESVKKGKEVINPLNPLEIKKTVGETMTRIPKGAFKKASYNPNVRASQNYSIMEDLP